MLKQVTHIEQFIKDNFIVKSVNIITIKSKIKTMLWFDT